MKRCTHFFRLFDGTVADCDGGHYDLPSNDHRAVMDDFTVTWETGSWFDGEHDNEEQQSVRTKGAA